MCLNGRIKRFAKLELYPTTNWKSIPRATNKKHHKLRSHVHQKINQFFSLIVLCKENIHALETSTDVFIFVPHKSKSQQREAAVTVILSSVGQQLIGLLRARQVTFLFLCYSTKYLAFFILFQLEFLLLEYRCPSADLCIVANLCCLHPSFPVPFHRNNFPLYFLTIVLLPLLHRGGGYPNHWSWPEFST